MAPSKLVNKRDDHWDNFDMSYPHGSIELPKTMSDSEVRQRIQARLMKRGLMLSDMRIDLVKVDNGVTNLIFYGMVKDPWGS